MLAFTGCRELLGTADWASQRDLIRALVKRVEVAHNEVHVVFRIDPYPSDNDPEKKRLQLCRGREQSALGKPLPALCLGPLGRAVAPQACTGRGHPRAVL